LVLDLPLVGCRCVVVKALLEFKQCGRCTAIELLDEVVAQGLFTVCTGGQGEDADDAFTGSPWLHWVSRCCQMRR